MTLGCVLIFVGFRHDEVVDAEEIADVPQLFVVAHDHRDVTFEFSALVTEQQVPKAVVKLGNENSHPRFDVGEKHFPFAAETAIGG